MDYLKEFIKPELLILIPVLYFVGIAIKKSKVFKDKYIPLILGCIAILLTGLYLLATTDICDFRAIATAIFTAITQGILCAAASVYVNQLLKQSKKEE